MACRKPCPTCPWRVDRHADTIPNFKLDLAEGLASTTSDQFGAPVFACHQSQPAAEVVCVGWLVRYGGDSIAIRMRLLEGLMQREELEIGDDWPDLHETFQEVIEKLRADVARMEESDG